MLIHAHASLSTRSLFNCIKTSTVPSRLIALFFAIGALACGRDSTEPSTFPNVAGRYLRADAVGAVTCTPQRPPTGGTVVLDAFSQSTTVRIQQSAGRVTLNYVDFPGSDADTGSVDHNGRVTLGFKETFQEDPRAGNRIFFVDLTATQTLDRVDNGARLAGTGSYVNVFHEGTATASIFATCSRTATITLTRIGD